MTAPAVELKLAHAREITDKSMLRIGRENFPVLSLYVTPSGARVVQLPGEQAPRVFLPDDIVTLIVAVEGNAA